MRATGSGWIAGGVAAVLAVLAIPPLAAARTAGAFHQPIAIESLGEKLDPGYHRPLDVDAATPADWARLRSEAANGRLRTLPTWSRSFQIGGQGYDYTLVGAAPSKAQTTVIPTIIVPIRLTVSDYSEDGVHPLVFDGEKAAAAMLGSPIFQPSPYAVGNLQFVDAMLRTEFPEAPKGWHTVFSPSVAAPIDIVAPPGTVKVYKTKAGRLLGVIENSAIIDSGVTAPVNEWLKRASPQVYPIFVTYNSVEAFAFGYHSWKYVQKRTAAVVYAYTSWLDGLNDAFKIPSPDAATLAHEIAESTHDPLITSKTLLWGDAFRDNRCFQSLIEVGDAVEYAPAKVQLWKQTVQAGGTVKTYTLQTEALLPWFERETPSTALNGAYSFPDFASLTSAAPLTCAPR